MDYLKPKELLNPKKSLADYTARQIAKETKDKFKIPFFVVSSLLAIVAIITPILFDSSKNINERINNIDSKLELLTIELKSFSKNDTPKYLEKDSLSKP